MSYIGNPVTTAAFPAENFSGTGSQTAYTMSVAPANTASVFVFISGVKQDPTTYSVNGTTLTFSAAPPSGTNNISVIYMGVPANGVTTTAYRSKTEYTATAGQTTFTPPSYTVGFVDVLRNGVSLGSADYTATNGTTVVLAAAASAGDLITIVSFYVSSVLNAIPATAGAVTDTYLNTGAVTQVKVATGVAGTGPAFSVVPNTTQSITTSVETKVAFQTENFDTANCFDNTTNYRFTPNVAGYYQFNYGVRIGGSGFTFAYPMLYKNGSRYRISAQFSSSSGLAAGNILNGSEIVYLNGSTDYVELYCNIVGTSPSFNFNDASSSSYFSGFLARAA